GGEQGRNGGARPAAGPSRGGAGRPPPPNPPVGGRRRAPSKRPRGPPATSVARRLLAIYSLLVRAHTAPTRPAMPMACNTSALRRPASASALRVAAKVTAALVGPRVRTSVRYVRKIKIRPPTVAAKPIKT